MCTFCPCGQSLKTDLSRPTKALHSMRIVRLKTAELCDVVWCGVVWCGAGHSELSPTSRVIERVRLSAEA